MKMAFVGFLGGAALAGPAGYGLGAWTSPYVYPYYAPYGYYPYYYPGYWYGYWEQQQASENPSDVREA